METDFENKFALYQKLPDKQKYSYWYNTLKMEVFKYTDIGNSKIKLTLCVPNNSNFVIEPYWSERSGYLDEEILAVTVKLKYKYLAFEEAWLPKIDEYRNSIGGYAVCRDYVVIDNLKFNINPHSYFTILISEEYKHTLNDDNKPLPLGTDIDMFIIDSSQETISKRLGEIQDYNERVQIEEIKGNLRIKQEKERLNKIAQMELEEEGVIFMEEHKRAPIPKDIADFVYRRDGGKCVYCGSTENLQFDHIIPFSKGGATTAENFQILCQKCNLKKSNHIGDL